MTTRYEIDTAIRLTVNFTLAADNSPIDPVNVILRVKPPGSTEALYAYGGGQVLRDEVGVYYCDLLPDKVGRWRYKWQGDGGVEVTTPDTSFIINRTVFPDL